MTIQTALNAEFTTTRWVHRKLADTIVNEIRAHQKGALIIFVEADAGTGKTVLAREIGMQLGSRTGYDAARTDSELWPGLLDTYDPDTNTNRGLERRLVTAHESTASESAEFDDYRLERRNYDVFHAAGITGGALERQRQIVEKAFAVGLDRVAKRHLPVIALDTTERLAGSIDPVQRALNLPSDTTSVVGWLAFQITQVGRGVLLLFGRKSDKLWTELKRAVQHERNKLDQPRPVRWVRKALRPLTAAETNEIWQTLSGFYGLPFDKTIKQLKTQVSQKAGGNPLSIDLALFAVTKAGQPLQTLLASLRTAQRLETVQTALLDAYMNNRVSAYSGRLLLLLALARNGLSQVLLRHIEPSQHEALWFELERWEAQTAPFLKVRVIHGAKVFFLHDAMYRICDAMLVNSLSDVLANTRRIVTWYDSVIPTHDLLDKNHAATLVESLFYRMRGDPYQGYQWYLRMSDLAVRNGETGLDLQLKDALTLYLISASHSDDPLIASLASPIDQQVVAENMPELFQAAEFDGYWLWIKRFTIRGNVPQAVEVGEHGLAFVKAHKSKASKHGLSIAGINLWLGQALMYGFKPEAAKQCYRQVQSLIESEYLNFFDADTILPPPERLRLTMVVGRMYNNLGFTYWMYEGRYTLAIQEFQRALRVLQAQSGNDTGLIEELANVRDNIGRTYAMLEQHEPALVSIEKGLKLRESTGQKYRIALSNLSLAIAQISRGKLETAYRLISKDLQEFRRIGVLRGVGLALHVKGMTLRRRAEAWRETSKTFNDALDYLKEAENDLREAESLFTTAVTEPIRLIQVRNELASVHRARCFVYASLDELTQEQNIDVQLAEVQAERQYREVIQLAARSGYVVEELDALQDLSVLLFRTRRLDEAVRCCEQVVQRIPNDHKVVPGKGLSALPPNQRIDAYYKLMGQVELLNGAIADRGGSTRLTQNQSRGETRETLLVVLEHYVLAVSYFQQFSGPRYVDLHTYQRISKRFGDCPADLVKEIMDVHLPSLVKKYHAPHDLLTKTFTDVFGLA